MDRKEFLKKMGLLMAGAVAVDLTAKANSISALGESEIPEIAAAKSINSTKIAPLDAKLDKPITVMVIGAGSRGNTYARYAQKFPGSMKVVADLNPNRRRAMAKKHNIPKENQFAHFNDALSRPQLADAVIISTPDNLHYEPCMKALALGYNVLLEKPVAPTERECRAILKQAHKYNRIVAVCHVLRYAPYFIALKEVLDSGAIGDIVSIQHMEPIQYAHMAHSYVRGNWPLSTKTTPIILAKSCHDLDILRWLIGKPCETIAAEGSLHLFRPENMPKGAPERCTDGCPHEAECPYSAIDIYERRKRHLYVFDLPRRDPAHPREAQNHKLWPLRIPLQQRPVRPLCGNHEVPGRHHRIVHNGCLHSLGWPSYPYHGNKGLYRGRYEDLHILRLPLGTQECMESEGFGDCRLQGIGPRRWRPRSRA